MALSRNEDILLSKINETTYSKKPLSRIEELLLSMPAGGGGSSGDYSPTYDLDDMDLDDIFDDLSTDNDHYTDEDFSGKNDLNETDIDDVMSVISADNGTAPSNDYLPSNDLDDDELDDIMSVISSDNG